MEAEQSSVGLLARTGLETQRWGYRRSQVDRFLLSATEGEGTWGGNSSSESWATLVRALVVRAMLLLGAETVIGAVTSPAVSATLLVLVVVAIQPLYGRRRFQRFVRLVGRQPSARIRYYVGAIAGSWMYVGAVAVIGALASRHPDTIGLTAHAANSQEGVGSTSAIVSAAIALTVSTAILWAADPKLVARVRRMVLPLTAILPRSRTERLIFAGVALTAGICEEILYRGFGIAYLRWLDPKMSHAAIIAITAAAFGMAHLYQGPRNVLLTGVVGVILASLTLATGTLMPAIVIHALIDLRVSFLPPKITKPADNQHAGAPSAERRFGVYLPAE